MSEYSLILGDAVQVMRGMADGSVQMVCTSPPYYGLRDYGTATWEGGDVDCDHVANAAKTKTFGNPDFNGTRPSREATKIDGYYFKDTCGKCGARRVDNQIGLEPDPDAYVAKLVEVFREVRRLLHPTGTCWIVIGDSYATSPAGNKTWGNGVGSNKHYQEEQIHQRTRKGFGECKPKDLIGIPWMVAFALRADGWYLRSEIIWHKKAPMPECLDPQTKVFIRQDGVVRQVTLDDLTDLATLPEILTPSGWRNILKVWETTKDTAIRFEAAKVSTVLCSEEHLWPVSHDRRREVIHDVATKDLRDTGYNDYLLHYCIGEWLPETVTEIQGQAADYDLGWLLGLYAAEGGFGEMRGHRCKFTLNANERDYADRLAEIVQRKFGATVSERTIDNYLSIRFSSQSWHSLAKEVVTGTVKTKSLNLHYVLNCPMEFRQGLWHGYISGDGSDRPKGVTAVSASEELRDSMAIVASSLGVITSKQQYIHKDSRTGKTYIRHQLWTPYIERRQTKAASEARQIPIRKKVVVPGPHRMIDLEVDGGLFLIDDGLCTHNSVTDRPTKSHEQVFLLAKNATYFYDSVAIAEPASQPVGVPALTGQVKRGVLQSLSTSNLGTSKGHCR